MIKMNLNKPQKMFGIFLIINLIVFSTLQLLRNIISLDAMEAITWGELISFGTNKHPPLSGWIMASVYNIFGHCDFIIYLLGQICILLGFIFIYKIAKNFLSEEKAICSTLILEACFYFTYYIYVNSYNCNVLLMWLWPMAIYYFYKSLTTNKINNWLIFGLTCGLGFLGKYQIVFLFLAMLLYLICCDRKQLKNKWLYLSFVVGTLVILPHIIWLFQNDFFSFSYMIERTQSSTNNLQTILAKYSHFFYPIKFIFGQFLAVIGCIALYLITAIQAKNISIKPTDNNVNNKMFLLIIGLVPIIIQCTMGLITGNRVPSIWGCIMISMIGIILFYRFPIQFNKDTFNFFYKLSFTTLSISAIAVFVFGILQTNFFITFPYQKIIPEINSIWDKQTNNSELKYVAGDMDYVFAFRYYNKRRPQVILETFGHKNPWVNHQDVIQRGALILACSNEDVIQLTKDCIYLLPKNYKITPQKHDYKSCNKLNQCVDETLYFVIIPPLTHTNNFE